MKQYKVITITHKTTSLNKLGKFVIPDDDKAFRNAKLDELKSKFHLSELLYLATCNRVCYFFYSEEKLDSDFIVRFFQFLNPLLSESELYHAAEVSRTFEGADAIQHLFEIASSLDSLVIGERQILNQLRTSYEVSKEAGLTGDNIRLAMKAAIPVAKSVYTHTGIGEKPVSVVSLAVQKLLETDVSQDSRFLMIGAGQTNNPVSYTHLTLPTMFEV